MESQQIVEQGEGASGSLLWLPAVVIVGTLCLGVRFLVGDYGGNVGGAAQLVWWMSLITLAAIITAVYVKLTGDRWLLIAGGVGLIAAGIYGLRSGWPYLPGGLLFVVAGAFPSAWRQPTTRTVLVATTILATAAIALLPSAG